MVGKRTKKSEKSESASNEQKNLGKKRSKVSPKAEEGDELETKKLHVDEAVELSDADDGNNPTDEDANSVEKQDVEEKQEKSHSAPRKRGKAAAKGTESSNNGVEAEKVNDASEKSDNEEQGESADDIAGSKKRGRPKNVKSKEKVAPQKRGRASKSAPVNTDEENLEDEAAKIEDDELIDSGSEKKSKLAKEEKESEKQNEKPAKSEDEEQVEKKRGRGVRKVTKNEEKKEVETRVQRKGRNQKTVPKYTEKSGSEDDDDDFQPKKKSRAASEEESDCQPKKSGRAAKSATKSKKRGAGASSYKDMCDKEVRIVLEHCKS